MISLRVTGPNFDDLIRRVELLAHPDLRPLAERLKGVMIEDNRRGLAAGQDSFGDRMADVTEATIKRGRGGDGPPLNPRGDASRMIAGYSVEVQEQPDRIVLIGGWDDPWVHFHATGTRHMIARDPVGIRPQGVADIEQEVSDFALTLLGGIL